jgi:hypothetical protein
MFVKFSKIVKKILKERPWLWSGIKEIKILAFGEKEIRKILRPPKKNQTDFKLAFLKDGTLLIKAKNPILLQEVRLREEEIKNKIKNFDVKKIVYRLEHF